MDKEEMNNDFDDKYKVEKNEKLSEEVILRTWRIMTHWALGHKAEAENEYKQLEMIVSNYGEVSLKTGALESLKSIREEFNKKEEKKKEKENLPLSKKEEIDAIFNKYGENRKELEAKLDEYWSTHRSEPEDEEELEENEIDDD